MIKAWLRQRAKRKAHAEIGRLVLIEITRNRRLRRAIEETGTGHYIMKKAEKLTKITVLILLAISTSCKKETPTPSPKVDELTTGYKVLIAKGNENTLDLTITDSLEYNQTVSCYSIVEIEAYNRYYYVNDSQGRTVYQFHLIQSNGQDTYQNVSHFHEGVAVMQWFSNFSYCGSIPETFNNGYLIYHTE
jgi:hypothetical protein